jgi:hypothetical protein
VRLEGVTVDAAMEGARIAFHAGAPPERGEAGVNSEPVSAGEFGVTTLIV